MKMITLLLSSMFFSSCMHVGMMQTDRSRHSGQDHEGAGEPVLEKEMIAGDLRAVAIFPPLKLGEEAALTLRLTDVRTAAPITGAQVYFHAQYAHRPTQQDDHAKSSPHGKESEHDINIDQEVTESSTPGVYTIPYESFQAGEHTLMFHVTAIGDETLEPELVIEATRNVVPGDTGHTGMMHGIGPPLEYLIFGGALMAVMMMVMWVTPGGIF